MSLHILDHEQGTDEWVKARCGIVTASEVGTIITPSTAQPATNMKTRAYAAQIAAERICGWTEDRYYSDDMERGHLDEPLAVAEYAKRFPDRTITTAGLMVRDDWGFSIGYSPDALVDTDGVIEAKSRRPKVYMQTVYAGEVPAENVAQVQCALLVSGREWCDFATYCGGLPLYLIRVEPDPRWQKALVDAVEAFEAAVADITATYYNRVGSLPATERINHYEGVTF